jgi:hypothetical protein
MNLAAASNVPYQARQFLLWSELRLNYEKPLTGSGEHRFNHFG